MKSAEPIPVIDLFAGPGGLSEGFSSVRAEEGQQAFEVRLSIERDFYAHRTLELRSFFRKLRSGRVPEAYYDYLRRAEDSEDLRRDKVAASKRKGIWMGGTVPIGYDVRERKLMVNQSEAKTVQLVFERYLELGSVRLLKNDLDRREIISATKPSRKGNARGGKPFSRGALYNLLSNPIYVGDIRHRKERYPGQHEAIVGRDLWERVQQRLDSRAVRRGEGSKTEAPRSPLAGKLFDESGEPLYVQGAARDRHRYRYYVSRRLVRGESEGVEKGWRISALEIEKTVSAAAQAMLGDRLAIALALEESGTDAHRLKPVLESARAWIERLRSDTEAASTLSELTERVDLSREGFRLSLKLPLLPPGAGSRAFTDHLSLNKLLPMQVKRRGVEMRMVLEGDSNPTRIDLPLLKAVTRARRWSQDLLAGRVQSVGELAKRERLDARSVRRLIPLGFLSSRIVEAIVEGRVPPELTVIELTRRIDLPLLWSAQDQAFGLS